MVALTSIKEIPMVSFIGWALIAVGTGGLCGLLWHLRFKYAPQQAMDDATLAAQAQIAEDVAIYTLTPPRGGIMTYRPPRSGQQ